MSKPLTATMAAAAVLAHDNGGFLVRHQGGYWSYADWRWQNNEYFGTSTIDGMVKRGAAKYTEWKEGRNGRFPVKVEIVIE